MRKEKTVFFKHYDCFHFSLIFLVHIVLNALSSHWVQELIHSPMSIVRIMTVFIYLPFFAFILCKFISDIKDKVLFNRINLIYYLFCAYYAIVSVWRFFNHGEVKETQR